jgi:outer membrane lipoprotein-sorting protein
MRTQIIRVAKIPLLIPLLLALLAASAPQQSARQSSASQNSDSSKSSPNNPEPKTKSSDEALQKVLQQMDATARNFQSAQAEFVWKMHNSVVNDFVANDTGKIYFRRKNNEIQMAADITQPAAKQVIFSGGKIEIYTPKTEQVDVYDASAHRDEFEAFLVLGFGSSGEDMQKSFDVKYMGQEKVGTADTTVLELTPRSQKIQEKFPRIDLWIDSQGFSLRQKLYQPDGDYRLAEYSKILPNPKISDNVFKFKRSGNTKTINH